MKRILLIFAIFSCLLLVTTSLIPSAQSSMVKEEIKEKYKDINDVMLLLRNLDDNSNNIFVNQFLSILYFLIVFFKVFSIYDSHEGEWGFILCLFLSAFTDIYLIFLIIFSIITFNFFIIPELIAI